jgi:hypothetical protein
VRQERADREGACWRGRERGSGSSQQVAPRPRDTGQNILLPARDDLFIGTLVNWIPDQVRAWRLAGQGGI